MFSDLWWALNCTSKRADDNVLCLATSPQQINIVFIQTFIGKGGISFLVIYRFRLADKGSFSLLVKSIEGLSVCRGLPIKLSFMLIKVKDLIFLLAFAGLNCLMPL